MPYRWKQDQGKNALRESHSAWIRYHKIRSTYQMKYRSDRDKQQCFIARRSGRSRVEKPVVERTCGARESNLSRRSEMGSWTGPIVSAVYGIVVLPMRLFVRSVVPMRSSFSISLSLYKFKLL
uniref:Uncharacterized protein n=1 Tax=Utricularia reniformis TaxID=192314 RepID=A0A1Y0B2N4_9LAMI|nr:hypothetical protein AEK19_MT1463 [Utricularia reniformis]ART31654.1 hypothetical protein AEK19_MT1463 [Utricularia reniformis]